MNVQNTSAGEKEIYDEIRKAIAERRLLPGTKLTEETLAKLFNLSRARVRKVLLILSKERMVTLKPKKSCVMCQPNELFAAVDIVGEPAMAGEARGEQNHIAG